MYLRVLSSPCKSCLGKMMNEIDGEATFDVTEINTIDNSRRLKRLGHEVKSEIPKCNFGVTIDVFNLAIFQILFCYSHEM